MEPAAAVAAIRLLLFTGMRRGEVLGLKWEHVMWEGSRLDLADSKTGAKSIHLNPPALKVLKDLDAERAAQSEDQRSPWAIPGRVTGQPLVGLPHIWQRIRARAGLADVRLHDLRHSYASVAAAHKASLPIIGALLGHTQPQTTARYAHLAADPLQETAARVGAAIERAMQAKPAPAHNVLALRRRQRSR